MHWPTGIILRSAGTHITHSGPSVIQSYSPRLFPVVDSFHPSVLGASLRGAGSSVNRGCHRTGTGSRKYCVHEYAGVSRVPLPNTTFSCGTLLSSLPLPPSLPQFPLMSCKPSLRFCASYRGARSVIVCPRERSSASSPPHPPPEKQNHGHGTSLKSIMSLPDFAIPKK